MEIGSQDHKAQYINQLLQTYQEDIWKNEVQLLVGQEALGQFRTEKARLDELVEQKAFASAGDGRKALKEVEQRIANTEANIGAITQLIATDKQTIEHIKKYAN